MDKSEYEIQHFNFSVEQFSLERRYYLNKILSLTLQSMVEKLSMGNSETKKLLSEKKENVKNKMLEAMEKHLTALEEMDRQNFCIPEYVLLASDNSLSAQYTETDEKEAEKLINDLKQKYLENSVMIASLKMEKEKYELICSEIEKEEKLITQVQNTINSINTQWEKTAHLAKEIQSLKF